MASVSPSRQPLTSRGNVMRGVSDNVDRKLVSVVDDVKPVVKQRQAAPPTDNTKHVRFTDKLDIIEHDPAITMEDLAPMFCTKRDLVNYAMDCQSTINLYKYQLSEGMGWNDDEDSTVRGLEDNVDDVGSFERMMQIQAVLDKQEKLSDFGLASEMANADQEIAVVARKSSREARQRAHIRAKRDACESYCREQSKRNAFNKMRNFLRRQKH